MKHSIVKNCAVAVAGMALAGISASAVPFQWSIGDGGNDHWYEAVVASPGISWAEANAGAVGMGGYLATLTSASENQWVYRNVVVPAFGTGNGGTEGAQAWLGGYPIRQQPDPTGWAWVTGEPWSYTEFGGGEPNGDAGGWGYLSINRFGDWTWNDEGAWPLGVGGYVVERGVPEGGTTIALLGLALLGLSGLRRRLQ